MWVLIIIGVAAIALGTWAFWPRGAGELCEAPVKWIHDPVLRRAGSER